MNRAAALIIFKREIDVHAFYISLIYNLISKLLKTEKLAAIETALLKR